MHPYTFPLHDSLLNYAPLIQIHRWFQFYEHPNTNLSNQLALFSENIHIKSRFDESRGYEAYKERVSKISPQWINAHHIQQVELKQIDYRTIELNLDIIYQNIGYLPNEQLTNTPLHYRTKLAVENMQQLPRFTEIIIEESQLDIPSGYEQFISSYPEHRIRTLIYYFCTLFDSKLPSAEGFKDIFSSEIDISLPTAQCTNFEDFTTWFQERPAQMLQSKHVLDSLNINAIAPNSYQVSFEFSWSGASKIHPETPLAARTLHQWIVIDNPSEAFARIQTMSVQTLPCKIAAIA
ncbi:hypothetical protein [Legionella sp. km772]|uniref:hypothetical protein n=1 Tax=Legionella sp. km772 TaxID=2498111 RepID=UPI000F8F4DF2|nr:hypothetical protein [Legionella sp. km772]RUR12207.1 hypothetical protein ELY15_05770 [Legionella sp. km772]